MDASGYQGQAMDDFAGELVVAATKSATIPREMERRLSDAVDP
jgi:hypothetical protein